FAFKHLMQNKKPVIRKNDLMAGTTTSKEVGVTVFPDGQGTMFWSELYSVEQRVLNPYVCTKESADILHYDVFPYWADKTFREYARIQHDYPQCLKIDERWVAYYVWKTTGISHTIPNFKRLCEKGINGIINDIDNRKQDTSLNKEAVDTLESMKICLEGAALYASNLSTEARRAGAEETNAVRKKELERLSEICSTVPVNPAKSLDEALNSIWISWVALHMENSNTGFSLGRLDQWLQPYFENDMSRLNSEEEKKAYIKRSIDLVGCFFMRLTDHVPMLPDIANYLFGGASSTQAITLGGIKEDGSDAVNDMTFIFLKVTEMLAIRDANINCRYHSDINSDNYLKRLCEVNIITAATPIMQNDRAVFESLKQHGYPQERINDWAATGCVEPTLNGKHYSHTAAILLNMVASMEMALNNGYHPLMNWDVGPKTGSIDNGDFKNFEDFFKAWAAQQEFLIDEAVELNNILGIAHQKIRPTPLLSVLIDGTIESCKDVLKGGALYNSSGTSNIGLADVTDSLLAIKQLVFDDAIISFKDFKAAISNDFKDNPKLLAIVKKKVPLFGSGDAESLAMANRVATIVHDRYMKHKNYRGGRYAAGFWSMSQHVAYGSLSGTLPSGRLAGKPFTPGLTPSPLASKNFLDNISDVAKLDSKNLDNNMAFNVKLSPGLNDSREKIVDNMFAYVKAYFNQGGMQMQFNIVTSETLKDAMANPENYRNLMVRISGYNAYFVELNRDIQKELIERAEYSL
ncbi:MAG: formate acetyltransferase, partial [bacterium]|nr:formate acetyltransferase [bacterium]